jgi:hypothetical protein
MVQDGILRPVGNRPASQIVPRNDRVRKWGLARISQLLRNFVPVPYLPRPESYRFKSTTYLDFATTYVRQPFETGGRVQL